MPHSTYWTEPSALLQYILHKDRKALQSVSLELFVNFVFSYNAY